jgi:hypothetical protein
LRGDAKLRLSVQVDDLDELRTAGRFLWVFDGEKLICAQMGNIEKEQVTTMNADSWSIFHDGDIVAVSGKIPGDLVFAIQVDFLRDKFPEPGSAFNIRVTECDTLSFLSFRTNETASGPGALTGCDFEILNAKLDGDILVVTTTGGQLSLHYQSESIELDSGRRLELSEVEAAARREFSEWEEQNNKA